MPVDHPLFPRRRLAPPAAKMSRVEKEIYVDETIDSNESRIWIPDVDDECKPILGMSLDSIEEAEKFYKNYAKIVGFCVRKSSTKYHDIDGSKDLYMRDFVIQKKDLRPHPPVM
ncbi:hypothetical protein QJS10_CPA02g01015 [Acorus calamus]|uniref:Protein FAR1-RELATED SEQUENCE n=1 Tax=Acorus calamus TaxID=4465 RepID=A0AAV9FE41_ACOCL|nr:hypothetical protein QJS10_CPA02g01015 [Acorus calamus]